MILSTSASYPLVRNLRACSTRFGVLTSPSRAGSSPSSASRRLIKSCIATLYICAILLPGPVVAQSEDALYADRENLASARRAADLWNAALADNPRAFDSAWKLARADYWLGGHAPQSEERGFYEKGMEAARRAIVVEPNKPEGHFWLAANMGALAEAAGIGAGLKYRKPIRTELETVLR